MALREATRRLHPLSSKGLPAYPNGWYALAFAAELPPGGILTRQFMGQDVVLFRGRSGAASVIDPYCPHLGAHLGYESTVVGDTIRCPFHYFCFDGNGECVSTGYGTKPPPRSRLRVWPSCEKNGLILVWYHAEGRAPEWEVPHLNPSGYSPLVWRQWDLTSHPQETTENSVDIGHLSIVHHYDDVQMLSDLTTSGPYLTVRYAMFRPAPFAGLVRGIRSQFMIHVHGLGYSLVEVVIPRVKIEARLFVLPTPLDVERITLRIAVSARQVTQPRQLHPLLGLLPAPLVTPLLNRILPGAVLDGLAHDVQQDFAIWQHKVYFSPPLLAEGDGPVGRYRYWAKQFYSEPVPAALE